MIDDDRSAECRIAVLLASPDRQRILVRDDPALDGPTLPTVTLRVTEDEQMERMIDSASELIGRPIVPLRVNLRTMDAAWLATLVVVEASPIEGDIGDGTRWASARDLRDRLEPADLRSMLAWWLDREDAVDGPRRAAAWTRPGFHERASAWMVDRMAGAGHPPDGPVRVVYEWPLSVVLRARSAAGDVFMKSSAPIFRHEASITAALAGRTPDALPEVLDVEPDENWLLMRDIGRSMLGDEAPAAWGAGLECLAGLQRAWLASSGDLERAGGARRSMAGLADQVPILVDRLLRDDRVAHDEQDALAAAVPRLVEACGRLGDVGVPETLVHGDLHPWNIARTPRGLVVFDWSDAGVGHPFVDLVTTVIRTDDVPVRRKLADQYFAAWPEIAAGDRVTVADLAVVVGSLYQVQAYLEILDSIDPEESLALSGAEASWMRRARLALDHGIAVPRRK